MVQTLRLENKGLDSSDFHTHPRPQSRAFHCCSSLSPQGFGQGNKLKEEVPAGSWETQLSDGTVSIEMDKNDNKKDRGLMFLP